MRIPIGPLVAALGAVLLIVSLFLDWYGARTAFTVFEVLDLLLVLGALATIVQDPFEQVFVAVYDVTDEDVSALDGWESADTGLYRKTKVRVSTMNEEVVAWVYVLDAFEGGLPSASYLGMLADAADAADAPADYVAALRSRPCRSNFGG